ncbi:unnamed protein product, partial [Mesorhabditis belari]|uniref:Medium-chain acyl-CoA ligase ACSF2, mitochondrial n=1 Tax=Mesorhabditis belari TaxID=2138241 RepID=A0AAF3J7A7_9BILA
MKGSIVQRQFARVARATVAKTVKPIPSYVHGVSSTPLIHDTVGDRLLQAVEEVPDKELVYFRHQKIRKTYEQFYYDVRKLARGFLRMGLVPGDRIGMWGPNYYEWICTQYAAALAGMIQVNVNPAYQAEELKYALNKVGVRALVTPRNFRKSNYYGTLEKLIPGLDSSPLGEGMVRSKELPHLEHLIMICEPTSLPGAWNYSDVFESGTNDEERQLEKIEARNGPDTPVNIQYTSGTTGYPKAATLTNHNIVNNAYLTGLATNYHIGEHRLCIPNPLYHCFGCVMGTLNAVVHKQSIVFPDAWFNPGPTLDAVEEEKCTALYGTPTMFVDVFKHGIEGRDLSSLRSGYIAGSPCPVALCERMVNELGLVDLAVLYGSTELSPIVTVSRLSDPPLHRIRNVGYVSAHTELCVVDKEDGIVPRGVKGELLARGYMLMSGYFNDEEKTKKEITSTRWYHTGDTAIMNEDGAISIVGRTKDMIIRGGENIYPTEIEQFMFRLPYMADAQVIGVPDERFGEAVCAWVMLKNGFDNVTPEQIKNDCREKMAHYKVPAYICIKKQEDFPVTATGKIRKVEMREIARKELGLENIKGSFD